MKHLRLLSFAFLAFFLAAPASAAEKWFEIRSPNFVAWSDANDGPTRTLIWQLEQLRNVAKTVWPWMKTDLPKPLIIIAVKGEQGMKELAPRYWEQKGGVRPGSVWVSGHDQHYIAIRSDLWSRDDAMVNPHTSAYFTYANLLLDASFERPVPIWLSRGLAGVISNTLVREKDVLIGATIPWELERLRQGRMHLREMLAVTRNSREYRSGDGLRLIDAMSWAFVHYVIFGDDGRHAGKLTAFLGQVDRGQEPAAAFAAAFGNVDDYEGGFGNYINRNLFRAARVKLDLGVDRARFPARQMTPAESAALRAGFHAAMNRPNEAQALIAEARKTEPDSAAATVAEALLLENTDADKARDAYLKAADAGTTNAFANYRAAMLLWRDADDATMERIERYLARAVELNPMMARAHASLAEARAVLKRPTPTIVTHMQKAVSLEPSSAWNRISAARVLMRLNATDEARKAAESALALAVDDPSAKAEAQRLLTMLDRR